MRVDFYRPDDPETVVGTARWDGRTVHIGSDDGEVRAALERVFRISPVVVEDRAYLMMGAQGQTVFQPGALEWFRAAALVRANEAGLSPRFVPEVTGQDGWDPAAAYRTFRESVRRISARGVASVEEAQDPSGVIGT